MNAPSPFGRNRVDAPWFRARCSSHIPPLRPLNGPRPAAYRWGPTALAMLLLHVTWLWHTTLPAFTEDGFFRRPRFSPPPEERGGPIPIAASNVPTRGTCGLPSTYRRGRPQPCRRGRVGTRRQCAKTQELDSIERTVSLSLNGAGTGNNLCDGRAQ